MDGILSVNRYTKLGLRAAKVDGAALWVDIPEHCTADTQIDSALYEI
jgi:hypothetical protein